MSIDWNKVATDYYDKLPHPQAPDLKDGSPRLTVAEYRVAVQLATATKMGGHATAMEAAGFWQEYKPLLERGMTPDHYLHVLEQVSPVSFAFHGRPPKMQEVARFWDDKSQQMKPPSEFNAYYRELPDKHYPHVTAGEMVKALHSAKPYARQHLGRDPVKSEAVHFVHGGLGPGAIDQHYQMLKTDRDGPAPTPIAPEAPTGGEGVSPNPAGG